jgi:hypothetical protein
MSLTPLDLGRDFGASADVFYNTMRTHEDGCLFRPPSTLSELDRRAHQGVGREPAGRGPVVDADLRAIPSPPLLVAATVPRNIHLTLDATGMQMDA